MQHCPPHPTCPPQSRQSVPPALHSPLAHCVSPGVGHWPPALHTAMDRVLEQGLRTPDLASGQAEETPVGTAAMTQAVIDELGAPVGGA